MSDPLPREWHFYIDDMIGFCAKVLEYTRHLDADNFGSSGVNYELVQQLRQIKRSWADPA